MQKIIWVVFVVSIIAAVLVYQNYSEKFDLGLVQEEVKIFGVWAPLVFIIFYTIGTIFIPSTPFMALAGILFGFWYGLLYTIIGGFLSSLIVFQFSRKLGKEQVDKFLRSKYLKYLARYNKRLEKGGVGDLIILRILPIMPFNVLNIIMGVSRMEVGNYITGTLIGLLPSNFLAVYFGDILAKIF